MKLPAETDTNLTFGEFKTLLLQANYGFIGCGSYAEVYSKRYAKTVVKIGKVGCFGYHGKNLWDTDAYINFLKRIDPLNPMFPKITEMSLFRCKLGDHNSEEYEYYYVVRMERLSDWYVVPMAKRTQLLSKLGINSIYEFEDHQRKPKFKCAFAKKAYTILAPLFRMFTCDIHDGNVMWRKHSQTDIQLVITDPIC